MKDVVAVALSGGHSHFTLGVGLSMNTQNSSYISSNNFATGRLSMNIDDQGCGWVSGQ